MRARILKGSCLILGLMSAGAHALVSVSDEDLSSVAGQDGLDMVISNSNAIGGSATQLDVNPDSGTANSATLRSLGLQLNGIGNQGVGIGAGGSTLSGAFSSTWSADVGANASGVTAIKLASSWTRARLYSSNTKLLDATPTLSLNGFGTSAFDSSGSFLFLNTGSSILNTSTVDSGRLLRLTLGTPQLGVATPGPYGQFYYRQGAAGSPELVFDKFYLDVGFAPGTGGIVGTCVNANQCGGASLGVAGSGFGASGYSGLYIGTPRLDFNMTFALDYRGTPTGGAAGAFTTATPADLGGLAYWGWTGGFRNAELLIGGGGVWPGATSYSGDTPANRTQGLNINFHGDYDTDFVWVVGQGGGREVLNFGNWTKLSGATWALNAPNITLDVINSGQGPGGLCWGANFYGSNCTTQTFTRGSGQVVTGQFLNLPPTDTNLALVVRDLSLQAYSQNVKVLDDMNNNGVFTDTVSGIPETQQYNWALIYTLGKLDENIYFYPGNAAGTAGTADGVTADVLWMTQSFGTGSNAILGNTNLMIADTNHNLALGLVQGNLLFAARKMNIGFLPSGIQLSSTDARFEVQGRVGGGTIPNMTNLEKMFDMDLNLETNNLVATLYSATSNSYPYLGYSLSMHLLNSATSISGSDPDGSFLSLSEPSAYSSDLRLANITGDISLQNGRVFLISAADTVNAPDKNRRLQIAQDIYIGTSVAGGSALTADVKFSGATLGTMSIPSGQWYSSLILKPQN